MSIEKSGPNTPDNNPFIPQLYMYLYKQRKGKKRLSSNSKKVGGEGSPGRGGRK